MAERAHHRLTDAKTEKPSRFYQPPWMSHWVQQRNTLQLQPQFRNSNGESRLIDWDSNQASTLSVDKGTCGIPEYKNTWRYQRDIDVASDVPQPPNEYGAAGTTRRLANEKMFVNTGNLSGARSESRPFPVSTVITQPISKPSRGDFPVSNFSLMQHGYELGETSGQSFARRKGETNAPSPYIQSREHTRSARLTRAEPLCNYRGGSMSSLFDNSNDKQYASRNSGNTYSRQNDASHPLHDQSTGDFPSPGFAGKQVRRNTGFSNIGFLPKSFKSFHHLLVAKTDIDLYKKDEMVMESSAVSMKNESSAETDTMDIETHRKCNYFMGMASPPANKDFMVGSNPPQFSLSEEKAGRRMIEMKLLDLNQKPASFLTSVRSMENMDSSTSRTESFYAELIPFHVPKHDNWHTDLKEDSIYVGLDPSSQQVKRLKLTSSDLIGHGTANFRTVDASSIAEVGMQLKQTSNYGGTIKEQSTSGKSFAKEDMEMDKTVMLHGNGVPTSTKLVKGRWDSMLSNPWIRRWRHNATATPLTQPTEPVNGKPQSSKKSPDEFQMKRLPSIAAMALLGKAMTGVQECEFTDKGSFVVWSTGE